MSHASPFALFLFAGEPSGDLHGAHLQKALKLRFPSMEFFGVGGPAMRAEGLNAILPMEDFAVMGFSDVIKSLPRLIQRFHAVRNAILHSRPPGVVLIDYAEFNLRLAQSLRRKGYQGKIIHYISPSVWAWRKNRIQHMEDTLDLLLTIFPFEKECFTSSRLPVAYVGNPLVEYLSQREYNPNWRQSIQAPDTNEILALFPGSRPAEIARNLPTQLAALQKFLNDHPQKRVGVSCVHPETANLFSHDPRFFAVPPECNYDLMHDCHSALAKSGTVTLELALYKKPTTVMYKLSPLNRFLAKNIFRLNLPHYCIVNILAGKEVFPELIQTDANPNNLYQTLSLLDNERRQACIQDCQSLCSQLAETDASSRAAKLILETLTK